MPLPRYQPSVKRLKVSDSSSANSNADDRCLARIIGNAISLSCLRKDDSGPIAGGENHNYNNNTNNNNNEDPHGTSGYSTLVQSKLSKGKTIYHIETNDNTLIEHLIRSSDKICSNHVLETFKLSTQLKNLDLFMKLMRSKNLGTSSLKISIDISSFELLRDVRTAIETFRRNRDSNAVLQLSLSVKDQKIPDCEEKIKNLVQIVRMADVRVYVSALQRISIDCCHLMWSTGRALQGSLADKKKGGCVFKITLKTYPLKQSAMNPTEITVPFGNDPEFSVDPKREDLAKHKEILRSLKKDCYNQFVKSVRENNATVQ